MYFVEGNWKISGELCWNYGQVTKVSDEFIRRIGRTFNPLKYWQQWLEPREEVIKRLVSKVLDNARLAIQTVRLDLDDDFIPIGVSLDDWSKKFEFRQNS